MKFNFGPLLIVTGFAIAAVLTVGFIFGFTDDSNSKIITWPATCPGGEMTIVYVPVDCVETCGVELPAERE
jgi:hypothetical protein